MTYLETLAAIYKYADTLRLPLSEEDYNKTEPIIGAIEEAIYREGASIADDGTVTIPVEELWRKA